MIKKACGTVLILMLAACNQANHSTNKAQSNEQTEQLDALVGCYHVQKDAPAQLYISRQDGQFFMQMKEPTGKWDEPEALILADKNKGWLHFAKNTMNIKHDDLQAVLVRSDDVMALAMTKKGLANINPQLDSDYLIDILGTSNTIYQVVCDNVPTSFDGHLS